MVEFSFPRYVLCFWLVYCSYHWLWYLARCKFFLSALPSSSPPFSLLLLPFTPLSARSPFRSTTNFIPPSSSTLKAPLALRPSSSTSTSLFFPLLAPQLLSPEVFNLPSLPLPFLIVIQCDLGAPLLSAPLARADQSAVAIVSRNCSWKLHVHAN